MSCTGAGCEVGKELDLNGGGIFRRYDGQDLITSNIHLSILSFNKYFFRKQMISKNIMENLLCSSHGIWYKEYNSEQTDLAWLLERDRELRVTPSCLTWCYSPRTGTQDDWDWGEMVLAGVMLNWRGLWECSHSSWTQVCLELRRKSAEMSLEI